MGIFSLKLHVKCTCCMDFTVELLENMKMGMAPTVITVCVSLAWKVFRDCIPTKAFIYARGLALNLCYQRCNDEAEDLQHLLFHSSWSVEVWHALEQECSESVDSLQSNTWREQLKKAVENEQVSCWGSIARTASFCTHHGRHGGNRMIGSLIGSEDQLLFVSEFSSGNGESGCGILSMATCLSHVSSIC